MSPKIKDIFRNKVPREVVIVSAPTHPNARCARLGGPGLAKGAGLRGRDNRTHFSPLGFSCRKIRDSWLFFCLFVSPGALGLREILRIG